MRPLNSKQRRIQFLRFLLLFVIAILPVVLLVHQDNQLDREMNKNLLNEVERTKSAEVESEKRKEKMDGVLSAFIGLENDVIEKASDIKSNERDHSATIEKWINSELDWPKQSRSDTVVNAILQSAKTVITNLNKSHEKGCEDKSMLKGRDKCITEMRVALNNVGNYSNFNCN